MLRIGERIGDYEITGYLGRGGMGSVYKVRNLLSDRVEALKILLPDMVGAPELVERFLREIKTVASLDHPGIACLHTALRHENQLLMIMEMAEGATLEQLLAARVLRVQEGVDVIAQVLAALEYAHACGVIHRDIKPANMMVAPDGRVKLLDFGIASSAGRARLTQDGAVIGSAHYMSPEQIRAEPLDGRSDLYSIGVTLYEITAGRRPFQADQSFALMRAHLDQEPLSVSVINPALPPLLGEIVHHAMEKDRDRRFQSAREFREALAPFLLPGRVPAAVPAPPAGAGTAPSPGTPTPTPSVSPTHGTSPRTGAGVDPAALEQLKKDLANFIGPMARVLVARAAKAGTSLDEMYLALAAEIPSEKDRQKFLAARRRT